MPVYIKKYTGSNYFSSRTMIDSLVLQTLPVESFPIFRFETEDYAGIGVYRGGDFDMNVSLINPAVSVRGSNIKDFFLGTQRDYYYLVCIVFGSMSFCGIAQQSQISGDFTYNKGKKEIRITCKDMLYEWAKRCETVPNSTITMGNNDAITFEQYMIKHFSGIMSNVVLLGLPSGTYLNRLIPYGNPQNCFARGNYLNAILNQINISRWETFKELAKGLGFNFEMYLNPGTEFLSEPEFIFNIFFIDDLASQTPADVTVLEHKEFTTAPRMEYLFLKARHFKLSEGEYAHGIFFNNIAQYQTDTNNTANDLYPTLFLLIDGKVLRYIDNDVNTLKTVLRDVDFKELEIKQYTYDVQTGAEQGKLYPLDEDGTLSGGMSYASIFNCLTLYNGIDHYDHTPVEKYAIKNYKRYLKGNQKGKTLLLKYNDTSIIKNWKVIHGDDGNGDEKYYISAINKIDVNKKQIEVDAILLTN